MKSVAPHLPDMSVTSVRRRVDPAPFTAVVAVGDLLCIGAFVVLGAWQGHGITDPARVASTLGTFVFGWAVAALVVGVYAAEARASVRGALVRTVPAWAGAAVVAQGLRATAVVPGNASLPFFAVSVGVGLALLVPWHAAAAGLAGRRQ